jgi:MFS family permease
MVNAVAGSAPLASERLSWRVAPPLLSTALMYLGNGVLGTLLPLRYLAGGLSPSVAGLLATADAIGFMVGCLHAHRLIAPVGQIRAYAAFAALKGAVVLSMSFSGAVPAHFALRFLMGFNSAGLAVIVESWLNTLVPNAQRGRVLTIYILVIGLFYGLGQLLGRNLNVLGPEMLVLAGIASCCAIVPVAAIDVSGPPPTRPARVELWKALKTSPASVLACLLTGLTAAAFVTVGPLFGERIGLPQERIIILMACVSFGSLFLQWPIGHLSDKIDRLYALIGLAVLLFFVSLIFLLIDQDSPFPVLMLLFGLFGGLAEALYPVGVSHANDRAVAADYVGLSSTLLLVWAAGGVLGPSVGAMTIDYATPHAFFIYVATLTVAFALFAVWRLRRRRHDRAAETPEHFLVYPQTSPEIYAWLPYHEETPAGEAPPPAPEAKVKP